MDVTFSAQTGVGSYQLGSSFSGSRVKRIKVSCTHRNNFLSEGIH